MSFLDTLYNETEYIRESSRQLDFLANAFDVVGNHDTAQALHAISVDLERSQKNLTGSYAEEISKNLIKAEQSTANIMNAALATVKEE